MNPGPQTRGHRSGVKVTAVAVTLVKHVAGVLAIIQVPTVILVRKPVGGAVSEPGQP